MYIRPVASLPGTSSLVSSVTPNKHQLGVGGPLQISRASRQDGSARRRKLDNLSPRPVTHRKVTQELTPPSPLNLHVRTNTITMTIESNRKQNEATAKKNPYRLDMSIKDATYSEADWPSGIKLYPETKEQAWSQVEGPRLKRRAM